MEPSLVFEVGKQRTFQFAFHEAVKRFGFVGADPPLGKLHAIFVGIIRECGRCLLGRDRIEDERDEMEVLLVGKFCREAFHDREAALRKLRVARADEVHGPDFAAELEEVVRFAILTNDAKVAFLFDAVDDGRACVGCLIKRPTLVGGEDESAADDHDRDENPGGEPKLAWVANGGLEVVWQGHRAAV